MKTVLLLTTLVGLGLSACDKDEEEKPLTMREHLLVTQSWRQTGYILQNFSNGDTTIDDKSASLDYCEGDNRYVFRSNHKLSRFNAPNLCYQGEIGESVGDWHFANELESELYLNEVEPMGTVYKVDKVAATEFKLSQTFSHLDANGKPVGQKAIRIFSPY